jgi:mevalonate kinase
MKNERRAFYGKVMLFGEYSVIFDSMGLTVPYSHFHGSFSFMGERQSANFDLAVASNHMLGQYLPYLKELQGNDPGQLPLDLTTFEEDLSRGLYFESTIPQGYGIGSSGALVAAIYDRYLMSKLRDRESLTSTEILALKSLFSRMESYFHGRSSGIDPLLCFISHPLLIKSKTDIITVSIPAEKFGLNSAIFLVDSGTTGQTGPLVNLFLERCREADYLEKVRSVFIPACNRCIDNLLAGKMQQFFEDLSILSSFQLEYLPEMIPERMRPYWETGLAREDFRLKLCGSGGGGFLLGISRDYQATREYFHQNGFNLVPVYRNEQS